MLGHVGFDFVPSACGRQTCNGDKRLTNRLTKTIHAVALGLIHNSRSIFLVNQ